MYTLLLALGPRAGACDVSTQPMAWPRTDDVALPTDPTLWIEPLHALAAGDSAEDIALLRDEDGEFVQLSVTEHLQIDAPLYEIQPEVPLTPDSSYTLIWEGANPYAWGLTTGEAAADAPGQAVITDTWIRAPEADEGLVSCTWDASRWAVGASFAADGAAIYQVELTASGDFDDTTAWFTLEPYLSLERSDSADSASWILEGATYTVRVRAIGADGSAGDWSDPAELETVEPGVGCAAAPASPGWALAWLALAPLLVRRARGDQ